MGLPFPKRSMRRRRKPPFALSSSVNINPGGKMQLAAGSRSLNPVSMFPANLWKLMLSLLATVLAATAAAPTSASEQTSPPGDPNQYMHEVVNNELKAEESDHTHWMYRLHKEDDKGGQDRQVIETKDGSLAKTLLINGRPLTPEQRDQDQERMKKLVNDPEERAKRERRLKQDEEKARQLLKAIPEAFTFTYDGIEGNLVR